MKRNFIFAVVLFVTLSIVNAIPHGLHKRATTFVLCLSNPSPPTALTMVPDPAVSGQTANFRNTIGRSCRGFVAIASFFDETSPVGITSRIDFCSAPGIKCPVEAGTPFSGINLRLVPPFPSLASYVFIGIGNVFGQASFCVEARVRPPAGGSSPPPPPPDGGSPPAQLLKTFFKVN